MLLLVPLTMVTRKENHSFGMEESAVLRWWGHGIQLLVATAPLGLRFAARMHRDVESGG